MPTTGLTSTGPASNRRGADRPSPSAPVSAQTPAGSAVYGADAGLSASHTQRAAVSRPSASTRSSRLPGSRSHTGAGAACSSAWTATAGAGSRKRETSKPGAAREPRLGRTLGRGRAILRRPTRLFPRPVIVGAVADRLESERRGDRRTRSRARG